MAKFVYRMQNILNIKQKLETQAQMAYSIANQRYLDEQKVLQQYLIRRVGYEKQLKEAVQGNLDLQEVAHARANVNDMKTIVRRQMMNVHTAEKEMEDARAALNEVMQERKVQEKLREKAFEEFKQELAAAETKEIDELVSYTYKKNETEMTAEQNPQEEEEKAGGKLVLALVTILIIAIWLGIIAILIKTDVGGFGSSILYPVLKDVPYINKILPTVDNSDLPTEDTQYRYGSLDEAVARIKELELELDSAKANEQKDSETIDNLNEQIDDLSSYKEDEAAFEKEKEKFYEEVVFSDNAPDINEYKTYYESIDPKNAEVLYKQVVEQITYDDEVKDYADTYSKMKPKEAAAIFDTMTDNLGLVADIMKNMGTEERGKILGKMDATTAAKLTEIMEPTK